MSLSERIRPGVEAAPWVIEEVRKLEAAVERLERLFHQTHGCHYSWVEARHMTAERQREACAQAALQWSKSQAEIASDKERDSIMASAEMHREESIMASRISSAIRATPLVTEGDK